MAKFEALEGKSKFIQQFEFSENLGDKYSMENVAGEQGLALQQLFPYESS